MTIASTQPLLADPFAGLTEVDAHRIAEAMTAAVTESTRTVYGHSWRRWERWCAGRGITPLPAGPAAVCAYLSERAAEGASVSAIDTACSAISYAYCSHGLADPTLTEGLRQVRRGLRRTLGTAPQRLARPLGTAEIRQIVTPIDRTTPKGARDAAIIPLGFASALRRSELTALTLRNYPRSSTAFATRPGWRRRTCRLPGLKHGTAHRPRPTSPATPSGSKGSPTTSHTPSS